VYNITWSSWSHELNIGDPHNGIRRLHAVSRRTTLSWNQAVCAAPAGSRSDKRPRLVRSFP